MITISITDDHIMVVEGLKTILNQISDIKIINTYYNVNDTLTGLENNLPQILFLDINLPDGNGVTLCKELKNKYSNLKIIALSNYEDTSFIKQFMKNGGDGYLIKNTDKSELNEAIKSVLNNTIFIPFKLQKLLINDTIGKPKVSSFFTPNLTRREKEVLDLIVNESTSEEIADKLFISIKTVEVHRSNLMQKLEVKNVAGLVRVALEKGLV